MVALQHAELVEHAAQRPDLGTCSSCACTEVYRCEVVSTSTQAHLKGNGFLQRMHQISKCREVLVETLAALRLRWLADVTLEGVRLVLAHLGNSAFSACITSYGSHISSGMLILKQRDLLQRHFLLLCPSLCRYVNNCCDTVSPV